MTTNSTDMNSSIRLDRADRHTTTAATQNIPAFNQRTVTFLKLPWSVCLLIRQVQSNRLSRRCTKRFMQWCWPGVYVIWHPFFDGLIVSTLPPSVTDDAGYHASSSRVPGPLGDRPVHKTPEWPYVTLPREYMVSMCNVARFFIWREREKKNFFWLSISWRRSSFSSRRKPRPIVCWSAPLVLCTPSTRVCPYGNQPTIEQACWSVLPGSSIIKQDRSWIRITAGVEQRAKECLAESTCYSAIVVSQQLWSENSQGWMVCRSVRRIFKGKMIFHTRSICRRRGARERYLTISLMIDILSIILCYPGGKLRVSVNHCNIIVSDRFQHLSDRKRLCLYHIPL